MPHFNNTFPASTAVHMKPPPFVGYRTNQYLADDHTDIVTDIYTTILITIPVSVLV